MIAFAETTAFDWVAKGRDVPPAQGADSPDWTGNVVAQCIPRGFSAYCKLFHPIHEDASIRSHNLTWDEEKRDNPAPVETEPGKKALAAILSDSLLVGRWSGVEEAENARVSWRTLSERYGLLFHPEFNPESFRKAFETGSWPRYLLGPAEGTLDRKTCETLISVLKPFNKEQTVYFRFSDYLMNDQPHLYSGDLNELTSFLTKPNFGGTPECWWPQDRSWCVYTDWDLTFTLIAGSRELVDGCLAHTMLECIEVTPETRIDYRADRLNLPKHDYRTRTFWSK
jgi:hypothetical protein